MRHLITDTDRRGAQVFAMDLNRALTGHERDVVALSPGTQSNPLPVPVLGPSRLHTRTLSALRIVLTSSRVTVAHGSSTLVACSAAGLGRTAPFVYRQISDQTFWARTILRRARVRAYLTRPHHVVALWEGSARVLHEDFGVSAERISVIPNGVPHQRFPLVTHDEREAARHTFGLPADAPVLLSLGALVPEKGVDIVVRSLAQLPDHWLLVIGGGPETSGLRALAERWAPGRVVFGDPVQDTANVYAAADVIVMPSRGGDSMPAVLIEAGMRGIPAVATPIDGIVDIISDGTTGRLVAVDDPSAVAAAVTEVLAHKDAFGAAARGRCLARYSLDVVAARWSDVLSSVDAG